MNKWLISTLLISVTLVVVIWAYSPLFITYAQVMPSDIKYEIGNKESIEQAIISVEHRTIEYLREVHGDSILALSALALLNAIIAAVFILKRKNT